MPPANLLGLNVVQPLTPDSDSQDLLAGQAFPELDLWANLAFENDDSQRDEDNYRKKGADEEDEEDSGIGADSATAINDGHVNVVTGTNINSNASPPALQHQQQPFDISSFLSGFGIDPFAVPTLPATQTPASVAPSLVQLLALQAQLQTIQPPATPLAVTSPPPASDSPPTKRARTRKSSVTTAASADSPSDYREQSIPASSTPLTASEDKRRRNTAASARFRLKKKEREAALESKAKELEVRVTELERECEGLRRENGWLKGLVVGVTGAAAQGPVNIPVTTLPTVSAGSKRPRDDSDAKARMP